MSGARASRRRRARPMSSAVTPPPRKRPRCVRRQLVAGPFEVTLDEAARRRTGRGASGSNDPWTSATRTGSSSRRPSIKRSRARVSSSRASTSRRGGWPDGEGGDVRRRALEGCGCARLPPSTPLRCPRPGSPAPASTRGCAGLGGLVLRLVPARCRSSPSRTSGIPRRSASRRPSRSSPPSPRPAARARPRANG